METSRRRFLSELIAAPLAAGPAARLFRSLPLADADDLQSRMAADPLRPQFHLLPAKNWMNDPNGPIFWKGMYHMFFQYNPNAAVWGDMHWAHAVSPDMIHWRHLPIALAPTPGSADADGCFTGSAVDDRGTATFIYTGVKTSPPETATLRDGVHNFREVQCLATSDDPQLRTWTKWKTPIVQPPADPLMTGFRDPFLWREGDVWYLGVGSGVRKKGGRVLLYRSKDLRKWEYLHPLASGKWTEKENINPVDSGEMWECPDFFALGSKHVLLYSTAGKVVWETGELDPKELVFHSQRAGVLDYGSYYAQKTQLDANGNRILWGWILETRPETEFSAAGWAGCMALPRVLSLNSKNDLLMKVASQAEALREKKTATVTPEISSKERASALRAITISNLAGELRWTAAAGAFSLTLADSNGPWWSLQTSQTSNETLLQVNEKTIELPTPVAGERTFHLLLDASVAEFFCDDLHVLTSRIYRPPSGPLHLQF
ncbi:MAG TPA: glycoside hydrolase family 32 protein, partial [Candidatus Acidoferrum sp.]